jgi:hypothetical protein
VKYFFRPFEAKNGKSSSYGTLSNSRNRKRKPVSIMGPTLKVLWLSIFVGGVTKVIGDMLAFVNPQILK